MRRPHYRNSANGLDPAFLRAIKMQRIWNDACVTVLVDMGVYDRWLPIREQEARYLSDGSYAKAVIWLAHRRAKAAGFDRFDPDDVLTAYNQASSW